MFEVNDTAQTSTTCLLSFVSNVTSAFDSRILHRKGATCARGGVLNFRHVVNHDTSMHDVHSRTVAFRQTVHDVHSRTVHSPD